MRIPTTWPTFTGTWFDTSTACNPPMSTPLQRSTAFRISDPVKWRVQLARGFGGLATFRSAGSGPAMRYGCVSSGVQIQLSPLLITRLPQQPNALV